MKGIRDHPLFADHHVRRAETAHAFVSLDDRFAVERIAFADTNRKSPDFQVSGKTRD